MNKIKTLTLYNISKNKKKGVPISKHSQNHLIKEIIMPIILVKKNILVY